MPFLVKLEKGMKFSPSFNFKVSRIILFCLSRSNVGKSSFINTLINRKNYAHTSSKPGKTQTLNFYLINKDFYFVDVPGYGYASVSKDRQKKFGKLSVGY